MKWFWILWGIDAGCTLIALCFFGSGFSTATNAGVYVVSWLPVLGFAAAILTGSLLLKNAGHLSWANLCAGIGALPGTIAILSALLMLTGNNKWN